MPRVSKLTTLRFTGLLTAFAIAAPACAPTVSIQWSRPPIPAALQAEGHVFVMEPRVEGAAFSGNVGRNPVSIQQAVLRKILAIVRERDAAADVAEPGTAPVAAIPGYRAALGGQTVSVDEINAARLARERGAAYLLVPSITEWKAMRTDDPIGAFVVGHNQVAVTLRLMCLQPPALAGSVMFANHARLTLNQSPDRLLDAHFRDALLGLLSGRVPGADRQGRA